MFVLQMPSFPTAPGALIWNHRPEHRELLEIDSCVQQWIRACTAFIAAENEHKPMSRGPLGEVQFWKDRHLRLSGAHEQLSNDPNIEGCVVRLLEAQKEKSL